MHKRFAYFALVLALATWVRADDGTTRPATTAASEPSTQPAVVSISDDAALQANIDKPAVVVGTVTEAMWSASGRVFLAHFKEAESTNFQVAIFSRYRDAMVKGLGGDLSDVLEGSKVQVAGTLHTYRDHPEILVSDPSQIVILEKGPGHSPHHQSATQPTDN